MSDRRFTWQDGWVAGLLGLVALALRVPFRSEMAYHWDSAQLAMAVAHFDPRVGLPHAPGFFLYVMAGRLVNLVVGDPHASLVWLSVVAGSVLPVLGYGLAKGMFGGRVGVVVGVLLATSPLTWFHSEVVLTTIVDSALVTGLAWLCWEVMVQPTRCKAAATGAMLAVVAGTRGQSLPVMLPLGVYALWGTGVGRGGRLAAAIGTAGVVGVMWMGPLLWMTGGWDGYQEVLSAKATWDLRYVVWHAGWPALRSSAVVALEAVGWGMGLAGVIALAELIRALGRREASWSRAWCFLTIWIAPAVLTGIGLLYTSMPGYVLNYFPALAVVAGVALVRSAERLRLPLAAVGTVVGIAGVAVFLGGGRAAFCGRGMTVGEIRQHDSELQECVEFIRARYRPEDVVIYHDAQWFYWGLRQFQYHLPEYEQWLLTPDRGLPGPLAGKLWRTSGWLLEFKDEVQMAEGKRALLVRVSGTDGRVFRRAFRLGGASVVLVKTTVDLQEVVSPED